MMRAEVTVGERSWVLVGSCPDRGGVVAKVAGFLAERGAFITDSQQHSAHATHTFFMRTAFRPPDDLAAPSDLLRAFGPVRAELGMSVRVHDANRRARIAVLASKDGACLNDLLYRVRAGILNAEITAVISNHDTLGEEVRWHGIPFHHLPMDEGKEAQEARVRERIADADLVVLARYMQILSPELCRDLAGRCLNIHHSFLPGFKGAKPYHQAFARGVKIIGATAHYVTEDLDEGPIVEQAVERVDHAHGPRDLAAVGRDIERVVLARAVQWHLEHRVLLDGRRTVVFR